MNKRRPSKLLLYFSLIVFATIFAVFVFVMLSYCVLTRFELLRGELHGKPFPILFFALGSLLLGAVITFFVGRTIIRPIQNIGSAFNELSRGNFDVRVPEDECLAEIREIERRFNAMTFDLSHIETLRSDFVANVSHEFKTPLSAIEGYATLLQNPNLSAEKHDRYVGKILENSRRLSNLSGNILMLSKLENRESLPDGARYRLDEQLRRCILILESKWMELDIEFELELPKIMYFGSESLLEQVWLNLLDNAVKHSPRGGIICVCANEEGGRLYVSVSDGGDGMTEEVQKHIFEKFYQGDVSRTSEGNGLGLALVKRIIELCQGEIKVESTVGKGAKFTVILPNER